MLDGQTPTSTLVVVAALAHPALLVEIEVIAAKPDGGKSTKTAPAEKAPVAAAPKPATKSKGKR
jgi:hypothetical protein